MSEKPTLAGTIKVSATRTFGAIPKERLATKIQKTVIGIALIGGAFLIKNVAPDAPWYVPVGLLLVGAHIASGELVGKTVKFFVDLGVNAFKRSGP